MIIRRRIEFKEVLRRWAIGEVGSKEFGISNFKEARKKLKSNQFTDSDLERCLYKRWQFYIPTIEVLNATWFLKSTKFIINEFPNLYTMNETGWKQKTNGSYRLIDAVNKFLNLSDENSREFKIVKNLENLDIDDLTGITLIYDKIIKKYIIVEGHVRLIALYNHLIIHEREIDLPLEFAIGFTDIKWRFSPF